MKLQQTIRNSVTFEMARKAILQGVFIVSIFACFLPNEAHAQITFPLHVTTTSDAVVAGACVAGMINPGCSLRGAIQAADGTPSLDIIYFNIPASDPTCSAGVCTINLTQALPEIHTGMVISGPGADKLTVKAATGVQIRIFTGGVAAPGAVTVSGLTISNGFSTFGAGVNLGGSGTVNITNCVISGNTASSSGAGVFYNGGATGTLNVSNSTITGNSSPSGSGILTASGTVNVINSTISGNLGAGGGIKTGGGTTNVTNSTVSGNTAASGAGGIISAGGTVNVKSTIVARNTGSATSDVSGNFVSAGFNLIRVRDGSNGFTAPTDQTGTIATPLDPKLDPLGLQNNGGSTRTIGLLLGSPAIDKGSSLGLTGNLTTDQRSTGFLRTFDNLRISNAVGGNGADIGALERRESPFDFDGDGRTDIGIFRPAPGEWWVNRSSTGVTLALQFGAPTDRIVPADYTGDGKADIAFWRPSSGEWYVLRSEDFSFFALPFGTNGDIPAPADYDADGKADFAVFRASAATWFISQSSGAPTQIVQFGINGDQPIVADYDNDGKADIGIFRNNAGVAEWWIQRSAAGLLAMQFGAGSDKPVQGDYTGDGKTDIAILRPSTGEWLIVRSEDFSFFGFPFGTTGDVVAPGDYDGDGKFDATVFRPSSATWFIARSTAGTQIVQFGSNGDRPIPSAFVP